MTSSSRVTLSPLSAHDRRPAPGFATNRRLRISVAATALVTDTTALPESFAERRRRTRNLSPIKSLQKPPPVTTPGASFAERRRRRRSGPGNQDDSGPDSEALAVSSNPDVGVVIEPTSPTPNNAAVVLAMPTTTAGGAAVPDRDPFQGVLALFDCQLTEMIWAWIEEVRGARRQRNRTLQLELDRVVIPPHWQAANADAVATMLAQYPADPILSIANLNTSLLDEVVPCVHPVVRVTIVDVRDGSYLPKRHADWSVVARYESGPGRRCILPSQTRPWPSRGRRVLAPAWSDAIVFNESLTYFFEPHVLILFELNDIGTHIDLGVYPDGTRPLAWAFLKPLSVRGIPNHGHITLQLYNRRQLRPLRHRPNVPKVYFEYIEQKNTNWSPYSATLSFYLHGAAPLRPRIIKGQRPTLPTDIEQGRIDFQTMKASISTDTAAAGVPARDPTAISGPAAAHQTRFDNDPCLIPTWRLYKLPAGSLGAFAIEFSPDGRFLACAVGEYVLFPIKIFDVESGLVHGVLGGHHDLVHDVSWSTDGRYLVTASSDLTAKVWSLATSQALVTLQHPCFVYQAKFCPVSHDVTHRMLITAGSDGAIRIWDGTTGALVYDLTAQHTAPIHSLALDVVGLRLWTGDATGHIIAWDRDLSAITSRFRLLHNISHPDLNGVPIACVRYDPGRDLVGVLARDSVLYVFGARRYDLRQTLTGAVCTKSSVRFVFSPDGQYVLSGSEDGNLYVWKMSGATLVARLEPGFQAASFAVAWSPTQHIIAAASFGADYPVYVYNCAVDQRGLNRDDSADLSARSGSDPLAILVPGSV